MNKTNKMHFQPLRVGASAPITLLREAYDKHARYGTDVAERETLACGREIMPTATDEQILKIARRQATLRGYTDTGITYHDVECSTCHGAGILHNGTGIPRTACPACHGDGFSPPFEVE